MQFYQSRHRSNPSTQRFIFATGIECSYPVIETSHGVKRRDQLEECRHYERWREDLDLTREMGIRYLRYGPPYYRIHLGPDRYDWSWTDTVLPEIRRRGIVPIMDLCHFGVPDWLGDFQNPEFPHLFARYAGAFARRYPWVRFYTPINEMYIAAEFSAYYGWWNERLASHKAFVMALKHIVRANVEAMLALIEARPDALFILCESSEHTHADSPERAERAELFNQRRFLSLDLTCGHYISAGMMAYLLDNGMTDEEYRFFLPVFRSGATYGTNHGLTGHRLRFLVPARQARLLYVALARGYYDRYHLPVMHTETNAWEPEAERWLWKTWANIQQLRLDGVPLCGMTWYSLTDQVDWDTALREDNGRVNPLGLYDLDRNIRPVGRAYRKLIRQWQDTPLLPNGPLTLVGPLDAEADESLLDNEAD